VLTCHWTVGVGLPVAAAVKATGWPAETDWLTGFVVTEGFSRSLKGILDEFIRLRDSLRPDIVLVPSTSDLHQDHAVVSQEALRAFRRSASMFGYDFPWNVLQTSPLQFFVELEEADLFRKTSALQSYKSQLAKANNCLTVEYVRALAIERGNRIGRRYAEAFEVLREVRSSGQQVF